MNGGGIRWTCPECGHLVQGGDPHDTCGGARAITLEYPDGTRLLWTREIPSNTWRCQVLAEKGEPMPDDTPVITGCTHSDMNRVLGTALAGTRERVHE